MLLSDARTMAEVTGGRLVDGDPGAAAMGLCTDSREVHPGCVFVAFVGERWDGHAFLTDAVANGARVVLVSRYDEGVRAAIAAAGDPGASVVLVPDPLSAVQSLARHHRARLECPVVGITGSTGKTTTKDMLAGCLTPLGSVAATSGNRNNELGVPLTLLEAAPVTDAVVLEMAMRGPGQIAELADIARPGHGLVTNVGVSHIEVMGSVEAIAAAKGELVEAIPANGVVYLNGDDVPSRALADRASAEIVRYGFSEGCDVSARDVVVGADGTPSFILVCSEGEARLSVPVPGRHNVYNALAAAAVALRLGVAPADLAPALFEMRLTGMRMQVVEVASGLTLINDAYNANPVSMRAALQTLADTATAGRRVAVLGGMAELGSMTDLAHFEIGQRVARLGVDVLVTIGEPGDRVADGARVEGMDPARVRPCGDVEAAIEVLDDVLGPGDLVLVKASRVVGLERVVEGIVDRRV